MKIRFVFVDYCYLRGKSYFLPQVCIVWFMSRYILPVAPLYLTQEDSLEP